MYKCHPRIHNSSKFVKVSNFVTPLRIAFCTINPKKKWSLIRRFTVIGCARFDTKRDKQMLGVGISLLPVQPHQFKPRSNLVIDDPHIWSDQRSTELRLSIFPFSDDFRIQFEKDES